MEPYQTLPAEDLQSIARMRNGAVLHDFPAGTELEKESELGEMDQTRLYCGTEPGQRRVKSGLDWCLLFTR